MAESNHSLPLHAPFAPSFVMPDSVTPPHGHGSRVPPPPFQTAFADHSSASPNHFAHQMPGFSQNEGFHYAPHSQISLPPYAGHANPRAGFYPHWHGMPSPSPSDHFPHNPSASLSHNLPMSTEFGPVFGGMGNNDEPFSTNEPTAAGSYTHHRQSFPQLSQPQMHAFHPCPRQPNTLPTPIPTWERLGGNAMHSGLLERPPVTGFAPGPPIYSRLTLPPSRRPSYERQHQNGIQPPGGSDRRPPAIPGSRRSDRSVSPRTSSRRSFERYANIIPRPGGSSDAEDVALRARLHRARQQRPRPSGGPEYRRAYSSIDGNMAASGQVDNFKKKLPRFVRSGLPEEIATCCDICQKDFSANLVQPTEDDEVAVQLPCKHVFGEYCLHKWLETCQKHKNKITCPMCRKLLVEPYRGPPEFYNRSPAQVMEMLSSQFDRREYARATSRNLIEQRLLYEQEGHPRA